MPAILMAIVSILGQVLGSTAVKWIAFKALIVTLITITLPIVLNNIIYATIERGLSYASNSVNGFTPAVVEFTGMGAWVATHLKLPEALSIVLGFVTARFVLRSMRVL